MLSQARAQLNADVCRVVRDRFLVGLLVYILVMSFVLRWMLPWLASRFSTVPLVDYYPLITGYVVVTAGAVICGVVGGLLLLETKEEGTIHALRVSPMPVERLLWLEASFIFAVTIGVIFVQAVIVGVGRPSAGPLVAVSAAASAFSPVVAVGVAALSRDKVEAFAWMKIMGLLALLSAAAWFVPEPWQWLAAVIPPYPPAKAWWLANAGDDRWILWAVVTPIVNGIALAALMHRWKKAM
ncbi:MAG: hypothetical protein AAF449_24095 [Myxococcota bacterium]